MRRRFGALEPVHVVGVGLHPYQAASEVPYVALGVHAVRAALADAGLVWTQVEAAYTGTATTAMAMSRLMYRHLGATGIPMAQVENASASGSTAFRQACIDVAAGLHDVVIAVGVDKPLNLTRPDRAAGARNLVGSRMTPAAQFALLAEHYMRDTGATSDHLALVAVKNHANGARNPNAQRRTAHSMEEVLASPTISGTLTRLECCPIGEGAAAVIVASEDAIERLGIDARRAVRVRASVSCSERPPGEEHHDVALTREATAAACAEAGITPDDLDVIELHDAFSIEELVYAEAMGVAGAGEAPSCLERGDFDIGGRVAISASGGLLAMGHPFGPTGAGQVAEVVRQLRGEAGDRQHPGARLGLTHMVGLGAVCLVHVLEAPGRPRLSLL